MSRILAILLALAAPAAGAAQEVPEATLASLVAAVRAGNPEIEDARRMAEAALARAPQAGALPDPMLSAGMMYLPVPQLDLRREGMTMGSLEIAQRLPAPGTRRAREAMARHAYEAALREADEVELKVVARLKGAYFEIFFADQALEVLTRNRALLVDLAEVTRAGFAVGRAPQQDVLRAQTEITRLDEQLAALQARRSAALAEANGILQRPATQPLTPIYPQPVRALATAPPGTAAFTAAALDDGLGDGFPSLAELQARATTEHPMLLAHEQRIGRAGEGVRLAERERFPDVEVMVAYALRFSEREPGSGTAVGNGAQPAIGMGRPNLLSVGVKVPLPIFASRKQRQAVVEAEQNLLAHEAGHHAMVNEILAEIAARYAQLVRTREQILLLADGVVPQARATVESAAAAYQAGRVEFVSLLDAQAALFRTEIELARQLADFGRGLAELELATGVTLNLEQAR